MVLGTVSEYVIVCTVSLYWFIHGQGLWGLPEQLCVCAHASACMCMFTHACMSMYAPMGGHLRCSATLLIASVAYGGNSCFVTVVQDTSLWCKYWA